MNVATGNTTPNPNNIFTHLIHSANNKNLSTLSTTSLSSSLIIAVAADGNGTFGNGNDSDSAGISVPPIETGSPYPLWFLIFLWLMALIMCVETILGNLMVVMAYHLDHHIQRHLPNQFIISLAVSDLIIGLEGFPLLTVYVSQGQKWPLGELACQMWLTLDYTLCLVSILTVLLITIDRYGSVVYPAQYLQWQSQRKIRWMITLSWVIPALLFGALIFGWSAMTGESASSPTECYAPFLNDPYVNMSMYIAYYWTTLVTMLILYRGIHTTAKALELKGDAREKRNLAILMGQRCMTQVGVGLLLQIEKVEKQEEKCFIRSSAYHGRGPSNGNNPIYDHRKQPGMSMANPTLAPPTTGGGTDRGGGSGSDRGGAATAVGGSGGGPSYGGAGGNGGGGDGERVLHQNNPPVMQDAGTTVAGVCGDSGYITAHTGNSTTIACDVVTAATVEMNGEDENEDFDDDIIPDNDDDDDDINIDDDDVDGMQILQTTETLQPNSKNQMMLKKDNDPSKNKWKQQMSTRQHSPAKQKPSLKTDISISSMDYYYNNNPAAGDNDDVSLISGFGDTSFSSLLTFRMENGRLISKNSINSASTISRIGSVHRRSQQRHSRHRRPPNAKQPSLSPSKESPTTTTMTMTIERFIASDCVPNNPKQQLPNNEHSLSQQQQSVVPNGNLLRHELPPPSSTNNSIIEQQQQEQNQPTKLPTTNNTSTTPTTRPRTSSSLSQQQKGQDTQQQQQQKGPPSSLAANNVQPCRNSNNDPQCPMMQQQRPPRLKYVPRAATIDSSDTNIMTIGGESRHSSFGRSDSAAGVVQTTSHVNSPTTTIIKEEQQQQEQQQQQTTPSRNVLSSLFQFHSRQNVSSPSASESPYHKQKNKNNNNKSSVIPTVSSPFSTNKNNNHNKKSSSPTAACSTKPWSSLRRFDEPSLHSIPSSSSGTTSKSSTRDSISSEIAQSKDNINIACQRDKDSLAGIEEIEDIQSPEHNNNNNNNSTVEIVGDSNKATAAIITSNNNNNNNQYDNNDTNVDKNPNPATISSSPPGTSTVTLRTTKKCTSTKGNPFKSTTKTKVSVVGKRDKQKKKASIKEPEIKRDKKHGRGHHQDPDLGTPSTESHSEPIAKRRKNALISIMNPANFIPKRRKKTKAEKRARKAFRTITIIVGAFAIFWSPYYIVATIYGFCADCVPTAIFLTSYYLCYLNSSGNPFAYALANRQFRNAFLRILRGDFRRFA